MSERSTVKLAKASGALLIAFLLLIIAVRLIDVQPIGPEGSRIGLAGINGAISHGIGVHDIWYKFTEMLGTDAILVGLGFGVFGLIQLIRRRSFKKVDTDIYLLAALYVVLGIIYVFFEICVINYRPVILDEGLEASFPSSHTMLVITIMGAAAYQFHRRINSRPVRLLTEGLSVLVILLMVIGRMASGVHWFTDILGGTLLGAALVMAYITAVRITDSRIDSNHM